MEIRELNKEDLNNAVVAFGQKIVKFDMLKFGENCFNLGAFDEGRLVAIITTEPRKLIKPLDAYTDLFIDYIEVLKPYQNQGLATKLISLAEDFGRKQGFFQITGWSDDGTVEMNHLALKLKYTMCQALMYDENYLPEELGKSIKGYYYGKRWD